MRKSIIISFLILLVIMISTPWVLGYKIKKEYTSIVASLNHSDSSFKTEITSYQMGFVHSTVTYKVSRKGSTPGFFSLTGRTDISHGPIVYDRLKKTAAFALGSASDIITFTLEQNGQPVTIASLHEDSLFHFNNTITSKMRLEKINFPGLAWSGFTSDMLYGLKDAALNTLSFKLKSSPLTIQHGNANNPQQAGINLSAMTMNCDISNLLVLPVKNCSMTLPELSLQYGNQAPYVLNGLSTTGISSLNDNHYSTQFTVQINKMTLPGLTIPDANTLRLNIALNNLNAADIKTSITTLQTGNPNAVTTLLTPETAFILALSFNTSLGNFFFQGNVDWKALAQQKVTSVEQLTNIVHGMGNLKVSMPLAKKLAAWIATVDPSYASQLKQNATLNDPTLGQSTEAKNQFDKQVALLVQQQKITLPDAITIMNLHETNPAMDAFSATVNSFNINDESKTALITAETKSAQLVNAAKEEAMTPEQLGMLLINDWLQRGYLIQQNNDYIAVITMDKGALQVNQHPVQYH